MIDRVFAFLFWPCLIVVWIDAALVAAVTVGLSSGVLRGALWLTAALAVVHFALMLFDGATRKAVNAYNEQEYAWVAGKLSRQDLGAFRRSVWSSLKRWPLLKWTTLVLVGELMVAGVVEGNRGPPLIAELLGCAGFLTVTVTFLQLKTSPTLAEAGPGDR